MNTAQRHAYSHTRNISMLITRLGRIGLKPDTMHQDVRKGLWHLDQMGVAFDDTTLKCFVMRGARQPMVTAPERKAIKQLAKALRQAKDRLNGLTRLELVRNKCIRHDHKHGYGSALALLKSHKTITQQDYNAWLRGDHEDYTVLAERHIPPMES